MVARVITPPGSRFGRLEIIEEVESKRFPSGQIGRRFRLICDCGNYTEVGLSNLRAGQTTSCGCFFKEQLSRSTHRIRHGQTRTPTYRSWQAMLERARGITPEKARRYQERGITVCNRWKSFEAFLADMGERPVGMTIDRIDNDGPYEPENCRWATPKEQSSNKQNSIHVILAGAKVCLAEAARIVKRDPQTIRTYASLHSITYQQAVDHYISKQKGAVP